MLLQLSKFDLAFDSISNLHYKNCGEVFPDTLKTRLSLKTNLKAKKESEAAYILLNNVLTNRYNLSLKGLRFSEKGKPFLEDGLNISVSHSCEYVCVAVSPSPIGIDIEQVREFNPKIINRYFSEEERNFILSKDSSYRFFTLWTLKEAIIKQQGGSISELSKIKLSIVEDEIFYEDLKLHTEIHENYIISVCYSEKTDK